MTYTKQMGRGSLCGQNHQCSVLELTPCGSDQLHLAAHMKQSWNAYTTKMLTWWSLEPSSYLKQEWRQEGSSLKSGRNCWTTGQAMLSLFLGATILLWPKTLKSSTTVYAIILTWSRQSLCRAFAVGIVPRASFRDEDFGIEEFDRQAVIINWLLHWRLGSRSIRSPATLYNPNGTCIEASDRLKSKMRTYGRVIALFRYLNQNNKETDQPVLACIDIGYFWTFWTGSWQSKIVSEYDQEILQSQTADKYMAPWDTRKTN